MLHLIDNEDYFKLTFWDNEQLKMVSPVQWTHLPDEKKRPASSLRFSEHFEEHDVVDLDSFKDFITRIKNPSIQQPIQSVVLETYGDIVRNRRILDTEEENKLNEAEVRFSTIDPIIKAISLLTGCRVKLEETVKASDRVYTEQLDGVSPVSERSTPDYVIYHFVYGRNIKFVLIEAKTDKTLSMDTVAQVIGYFIASEVDYVDFLPPLGLILTQSKMQLIFFPYRNRTEIYVDAIITHSINLFQNDCYAAVIAFVTKYILSTEKLSIERSRARLHPKNTYKQYVCTHKEELASQVERIKQKFEQKLNQKDQELKQKDQELNQKDQELNQKDQELNQKDQELNQKDQELDQKDQELKQKDENFKEFHVKAVHALEHCGMDRSEASEVLHVFEPPAKRRP